MDSGNMNKKNMSLQQPESTHFFSSSSSTMPSSPDQANRENHLTSSSVLAPESKHFNDKLWSDDELTGPPLPSVLPPAHLPPQRENPFDDPPLELENPFDDPPENPFDDRYVFGEAESEKTKLEDQLHRAKRRNKWFTPPKWLSVLVQISGYVLLACTVYFFLVGYPLWNGAIYNFWYAYKQTLTLKAGAVIFVGIAFLYAALPLLARFEKPPVITEAWSRANAEKAKDVAVIIPCYKSAGVIQHTIECALKTFPVQNIFVIANGNSETPLDNTGDLCRTMGVRHIWVPIGSKISAQYVGTAAAYRFKYCLLIDDDVALPGNLPLVTERIQLGKEGDRHGNGTTKCIGYTLSATDGEGGPGNLCQQAQDLEYKMAGLTRTFFGKVGSSSFPHGAIGLWERSFLELCFQTHPGYRISEDWFFGLICKKLGGRIQFCSQAFVKTAVPAKLMFGDKSERAGYGELTVTAQRLWRWNFFLMYRILVNSWYLASSWRLRQYELFTKLDMFQELYSTLLLFLFPFVWPVAVGVDPGFAIGLTFGVTILYMIITAVFCEIHLRMRGEMVARKVVYLYYPVYKLWLRLVNIASCYTSLFNYARYFSVRHPKVTDDEKLLNHMLSIVSPSSRRIEDVA